MVSQTVLLLSQCNRDKTCLTNPHLPIQMDMFGQLKSQFSSQDQDDDKKKKKEDQHGGDNPVPHAVH